VLQNTKWSPDGRFFTPLNFGVVVKDNKSMPAKAEWDKSSRSTHGESVVSMESDFVRTGSFLDEEAIIGERGVILPAWIDLS